MRRLAIACVLLPAAIAGEAAAQRATVPAWRAGEALADSVLARRPLAGPGGLAVDSLRTRTAGWPVLASAILPGSGQALLRQDRLLVYAAVEALLVARYVRDSREARRERDRYRTLASNVARALFSDVRPVGDFEYYERMEKYAESGAFDLIPGGDLEPETDTVTFNGATWLLARRTYWADIDAPPPADSPEYARALAFYRNRAYEQQFRWSWRNAQLEYDEFRRTIRKSNAAYRVALTDLGLLLANHVLSTVDAFVTVRLRNRELEQGGRSGFELRGELPLGGPRGRRTRN